MKVRGKFSCIGPMTKWHAVQYEVGQVSDLVVRKQVQAALDQDPNARSRSIFGPPTPYSALTQTIIARGATKGLFAVCS